MGCNLCEEHFKSSQTVVVSVAKSGSKAALSIQNHGRNIIMLRRILLCYETTYGGYGVVYLRPPDDQISWSYPSAFLEPNLTAGYYSLDATYVKRVQAQAEYIELDGRSRSCTADF